MTTTGNPPPVITKSGSLPSDLSFTDNGNGTATISGTPQAANDQGVFNLTFKAKSSQGTATQVFSLSITKAPVIKPISTKTAHVGTAFSTKFTVTGYTTPTLTLTGLPAGLSFVDAGSGAGVVNGVPSAGTGGSYTVTLAASNASGSASQSFVLKVNEAPAITSPSSVPPRTGRLSASR